MLILQMGKLRLGEGNDLTKVIEQTSGRHRCPRPEPVHLTTSPLKSRRDTCTKKVSKTLNTILKYKP